jgi:hypothetical protein
MTRGPLSRRTVVVSRLLNWLCLRYGFAKPSVWLCRKACKPCQFNGFASDYPLTLGWFRFPNLRVLENWYVGRFRALRSERSRRVGKLSQSWSQSPGNVAGFCRDLSSVGISCKHCRSSSSRGRPAGTPFPSEHAGWVLSGKRPLHVAARRLLAEPAVHVLVDLNNRSAFAVEAHGELVPRITSPEGQEGTHHESKSRSSKFHTVVYNRRYRIAQRCERRARRQGFPECRRGHSRTLDRNAKRHFALASGAGRDCFRRYLPL